MDDEFTPGLPSALGSLAISGVSAGARGVDK
jgi:hypothetical protein